MSHLKSVEIIDAVEGTLAPERQVHARDCAHCRDEIARAAAALGELRVDSDAAHEPSPLFWQHFSARVRAAIDAEPAGSRRPWRLWAPAAALTALALVLTVGTMWNESVPRPAGQERTAASGAPSAAAARDTPDAREGSENSWALVADTAEDLAWDEVAAAGFGAAPGAADSALLQLSDDQQRELARLLEAELVRLKS